MACFFCERNLKEQPIVLSGLRARVQRDEFPLTEGHLLIVPHRHVASWMESTSEEKLELLTLLDRAIEYAKNQGPAIHGFNVGWNDGAAAGQTVPHLHMHVIPRRVGDVEDPRGGIRWTIPEKARYW